MEEALIPVNEIRILEEEVTNAIKVLEKEIMNSIQRFHIKVGGGINISGLQNTYNYSSTFCGDFKTLASCKVLFTIEPINF